MPHTTAHQMIQLIPLSLSNIIILLQKLQAVHAFPSFMLHQTLSISTSEAQIQSFEYYLIKDFQHCKLKDKSFNKSSEFPDDI